MYEWLSDTPQTGPDSGLDMYCFCLNFLLGSRPGLTGPSASAEDSFFDNSYSSCLSLKRLKSRPRLLSSQASQKASLASSRSCLPDQELMHFFNVSLWLCSFSDSLPDKSDKDTSFYQPVVMDPFPPSSRDTEKPWKG